jgi:hypothetical protein
MASPGVVEPVDVLEDGSQFRLYTSRRFHHNSRFANNPELIDEPALRSRSFGDVLIGKARNSAGNAFFCYKNSSQTSNVCGAVPRPIVEYSLGFVCDSSADGGTKSNDATG